jgi:hypothetical protein
MGKYGFFSHITQASDWFPVGATWRVRMVACGYPSSATDTGENIAAGYDTATEVFTAWKYSAPHNASMLSTHWKVIGIGFETVSGSPAGTYWTTDFGSYVDGTAHENGEPAPADTTAPTVIITSPGAGADVSSSVTVCVTATDNLAVVRVDLYANGSKVASDYDSPYAIVWDTTSLNPGSYPLEARAFDAAGNVGVAGFLIHVSSSPSAATTTTTTTAQPAAAFADVPITSAFYEPIMSLAAAGVVSGYGDGLFHPNDPVTRAQFTKIIVVALDVHTAEVDNLVDPTFTDVAYTGSAYPFDYVEEAAGLDIIKGHSNGTFAPGHNVTRLQLAMMLVRAGGDGLAVPPAGYSCPFTDVPAYGKEAVRVARYNGLLSGKTATKFDPYSPATRGHVAKMVYGLTEALGR